MSVGSSKATEWSWVLCWCPRGGLGERLGLPPLPQRKMRAPNACLPALEAGPPEFGTISSSLPLLTESELLSSAGPERWGAMGAGWLMTTREEASRGPAGEEPASPRSHRP